MTEEVKIAIKMPTKSITTIKVSRNEEPNMCLAEISEDELAAYLAGGWVVVK